MFYDANDLRMVANSKLAFPRGSLWNSHARGSTHFIRFQKISNNESLIPLYKCGGTCKGHRMRQP